MRSNPPVELADLLRDPARVAEIPPEAIPGILGDVEWLRAALWARMLTARNNGQRETPEGPLEPKSQERQDKGRASAANSLLSVDAVATQLACKPSTVRKWISRRRLPVVKVGRLVRVRPADLETLIARGVRRARAD